MAGRGGFVTRVSAAAGGAVTLGLLVLAAAGCGGSVTPASSGTAAPASSGPATPAVSPSATPTMSPTATPTSSATSSPAAPAVPSAAEIAAAAGWLRHRGSGPTALAVIDSRGRLTGYNADRVFASASLVKAMLLTQYLRTHRGAVPGAMRSTLWEMIVASDEAASERVFGIVGTRGLAGLARAAGMRDFVPRSNWAMSGVTAADQARFFLGVDRLVPSADRDLLRSLLSQRGPYRGWGIPWVARARGWRAYWKDGWIHSPNGELLLQAVRLERDGARFAVAVMADGQPSSAYGVQTMLGVGTRLVPH